MCVHISYMHCTIISCVHICWNCAFYMKTVDWVLEWIHFAQICQMAIDAPAAAHKCDSAICISIWWDITRVSHNVTESHAVGGGLTAQTSGTAELAALQGAHTTPTFPLIFCCANPIIFRTQQNPQLQPFWDASCNLRLQHLFSSARQDSQLFANSTCPNSHFWNTKFPVFHPKWREGLQYWIAASSFVTNSPPSSW